MTVESFAQANGIRHIDLLKVDVEGYEMQVLAGAKRFFEAGDVGFLYIESEPIDTERHFIPLQTLHSHVAQFGYQIFAIYDQQVNEGAYYFNPVFVSPKLLASKLGLGQYSTPQ